MLKTHASALPSYLHPGAVSIEIGWFNFFGACSSPNCSLSSGVNSAKADAVLEDENDDDDWRLTKERRDEFFRSATPSYANRRHLDRLGD